MTTLYELVDGRRGHFLLESGLHAELWLDLDPLFADQPRVAPFVSALAVEYCHSNSGRAGPAVAPLLSGRHPFVVPSEARDLLFQARYVLPSGFAIWAPADCPLCSSAIPLELPAATG